MSTLVPSFEFKLGSAIAPGTVCVGKFDGVYPCLAAAAPNGNVLLHDPRAPANAVRVLSFGRTIRGLSSVAAAAFTLQQSGAQGTPDGAAERDLLLLSGDTSAHVFDVFSNSDMFFKDVPDGSCCCTLGRIVHDSASSESAIFVGSNCSIQGFASDGSERFWTVSGDSVSCIAFAYIDSTLMLVGSKDSFIRVYSGEQLTHEISETAAPTCIKVVTKSSHAQFDACKWIYALDNGTIGVYSGERRLWRMKSKMVPICIDVMDINDDGAVEVLSAWSGGKVEARSIVDGTLIFKDQLPSACAGMIVADYRLDSRQHCVVVTVDGLARGYSVGQAHALFDSAETVRDESQMEQLNQELFSLQQQLRNFELAVEEAKGGKSSGGVQLHVPSDTNIVCRWAVNEKSKCVDMVISTNNKTVINAVVLLADHIFGGESKVFYPKESASRVHVPFVNETDKGTDVYVKVFVGARSSSVFHVFERGYRMPQFSMFVPFVLNANLNQWPKSAVRFKINERTPDIAKWLNSSFNIQYNISPQSGVDLGFCHINSNELVHISGAPSGEQFSVCFCCDSVQLAARLVQDMAQVFGISALTCEADFPKDLETLRQLLAQVADYNANRVKLSTDMADMCNMVKERVVKAEDCRIILDVSRARSAYIEIHDINLKLRQQYTKREANHNQLLACLKDVNRIISRFAALRIGAAATKLTAAARQAIAQNDVPTLFRILRAGTS